VLNDAPAGNLRQGDVCKLPYFPQWLADETTKVLDAHDVHHQVTMPLLTQRVIRGPEGGVLVAVTTQCCDLENPKKVSGVHVAPLREVPARADDHARRDAIKASSHPTVDAETGDRVYEYIPLFPLELPDDGLVVIDLSLAVPITPSLAAVTRLKAVRLFQLDDADRNAFREKLAAFVGRPPEE
jgi:hypothetical protein